MGRMGLTERLDQFAALLEQDLPIPVIAERMGIGKGYGYALLDKIRERLGPQAR